MNYIFKVMVIGDTAVGKTSLICRYVENIYSEEYITTIGVEFLQKKVVIDNKYNVTLVLWDVAGQSKFTSFKKAYYNGSDLIIIVFDITRQRSYQNIAKWLSEAQRILGSDIPFVILSNKVDLEAQREVHDYNHYMNNPALVDLVETSAKTGANVNEVFTKIAKILLEKKGFRRPFKN
ncbi:MAG: GTP-binding protein [Candidatus Helarchaeota archaeon]